MNKNAKKRLEKVLLSGKNEKYIFQYNNSFTSRKNNDNILSF